MSAQAAARVACRPIEAADVPAVIDLLHVGFPKRPRAYWEAALQRLATRDAPSGYPRYGYLLRAGEAVAGVLLLIFSAGVDGAAPVIRGNVSSWYVRPEFRAYAPLLVLRGIRHPAATYLNVSPAPETLRIIAAQGFRPFSQGVFAALPALARPPAAPARRLARADWAACGLPAAALRRLAEHESFGCLGLVYATAEGPLPFLFRRRRIRPGGIPCAQLIDCPSLAALARYAAPIGRSLAARGMPLLLVAANAPLAGVPGRFFPAKLPMYCKGETPRPGDLSYTEAALFGL